MGKKEDFLLNVFQYNIEEIRKDTNIDIHLKHDEDNKEIIIKSLNRVLYKIKYNNKEDAIRSMAKHLTLVALQQLSNKPMKSNV